MTNVCFKVTLLQLISHQAAKRGSHTLRVNLSVIHPKNTWVIVKKIMPLKFFPVLLPKSSSANSKIRGHIYENILKYFLQQ